MIRVLQIRETPASKCAGIDTNCQGLVSLFEGDNQIEMLPTIDYTKYSVPFIHQCWLDKKEICDSIAKYDPDIVHVHGSYSFTLPVSVSCARKFKKPIVLSAHFHPFYSLKRPLMGKLFFNLITRFVLKQVNLVFAINNEDTKQMSLYHSNVVKLPHWSKFEYKGSQGDKVKNLLLFIGRLDESNKGIEHLFHLPEDKYEIHCVGRGEVSLRKDMMKHTNISDEELANLYKKASLLVVPSRYEAFSYVTIEALMSNTPVVLSDRVRIADHLAGINGYSVFKYGDYCAFADAVANTIGLDVDIQKVAEVFNPKIIKDLYKKAYLSVLKQ